MLIYVIQNQVNGKCYVGKTVETFYERWSKHLWDAKGRTRLVFHKAIIKYGADNFLPIAIFDAGAITDDELYALEQQTIKLYRVCGIELYNCTDGGKGSYGLKHTEEAKAKQRAAKLGTKHSPETIAKRVASLKRPRIRKPRPPITEETRARMSAAIKKAIAANPDKHYIPTHNQPHTEEAKQKMSIATKNHYEKLKNATTSSIPLHLEESAPTKN
jgi:group I intron endonuclease